MEGAVVTGDKDVGLTAEQKKQLKKDRRKAKVSGKQGQTSTQERVCVVVLYCLYLYIYFLAPLLQGLCRLNHFAFPNNF